MKYVVVLGDGMADLPLPSHDSKTPLELAHKPHMDYLAQHGTVGLAKTVPDTLPPGSETANLSVMGYDPLRYYTGRSPLEAVSMGIALAEDDITFRCNLVTLSDEACYEEKRMLDYSAGEIETEQAAELIAFLRQHFTDPDLTLYAGISYRHCLVMHQGQVGSVCTPPHDILDQTISNYLPQATNGARLLEMMKLSYQLLKDHPINKARIAAGKRPANSCWFWGEGTAPKLDRMEDLYGVKGSVVAAVDLIKGIGICAGLRPIFVPGATGCIVTNFAGKGQAALQALRDGDDFVYIHIEAPDESGHHADIEAKISSIAAIDREVLGPIMDGLRTDGEDFSILLAPDHPTPISLRTHTRDPIPFVLYRSTEDTGPSAALYSEAAAAQTGLYLPEGPLLMKKLIAGDF